MALDSSSIMSGIAAGLIVGWYFTIDWLMRKTLDEAVRLDAVSLETAVAIAFSSVLAALASLCLLGFPFTTFAHAVYVQAMEVGAAVAFLTSAMTAVLTIRDRHYVSRLGSGLRQPGGLFSGRL